jgi:hypothetical protein
MERELDEAANRTAYFLAVHSGKPGFVLKTEHLKTSADTALYCSTQHLNGHSVLQLFDGTPNRSFDSRRGQPTHSFLLAGF